MSNPIMWVVAACTDEQIAQLRGGLDEVYDQTSRRPEVKEGLRVWRDTPDVTDRLVDGIRGYRHNSAQNYLPRPDTNAFFKANETHDIGGMWVDLDQVTMSLAALFWFSEVDWSEVADFTNDFHGDRQGSYFDLEICHKVNPRAVVYLGLGWERVNLPTSRAGGPLPARRRAGPGGLAGCGVRFWARGERGRSCDDDDGSLARDR